MKYRYYLSKVNWDQGDNITTIIESHFMVQKLLKCEEDIEKINEPVCHAMKLTSQFPLMYHNEIYDIFCMQELDLTVPIKSGHSIVYTYSLSDTYQLEINESTGSITLCSSKLNDEFAVQLFLSILNHELIFFVPD